MSAYQQIGEYKVDQDGNYLLDGEGEPVLIDPIECPFCGGTSELHIGYGMFAATFVRCTVCRARGPEKGVFGDGDAIIAWNQSAAARLAQSGESDAK